VCGGTNLSVFNSYHYTVYVPQNTSIEALQLSGGLSSWEAVVSAQEAGAAAIEAGDLERGKQLLAQATKDSLGIENFLRYHIQDNALFIGAAPESGDFETALIDPSTKRFYRISAESTGDEIILKDNTWKAGDEPAKVLHSVEYEGCYNLMAREYQYNGKNAADVTELATSSSAVIHLIDKPLSYKKKQ
jgi:hypothetical protein